MTTTTRSVAPLPRSRAVFLGPALALCVCGTLRAETIFVDADNCPGPGNGTMGNPFCSIQDAIDAAVGGVDEVEVAAGTYLEAIDFLGKAITVYAVAGPELTVIDGGGAFHVVQCVNAEGPDTVLDGFTITGGIADGGYPDSNGAGMYNDGSSPTVIDCMFDGNVCVGGGGGMFNAFADPSVINCTFRGNSASAAGSAIGGGMYNDLSSATVINCRFVGNSVLGTSADGGAVYNGFGIQVFINCVFSGNSAQDDGGAVHNSAGSNPTFTNCSFSANSAGDEGGAMKSANDTTTPTLTNCVLWGDTPDEIVDDTSITTVTYSNVQGGFSGTGNIDADPLYVDPDGPDDTAGTEDDDLGLARFSPCIDAGDNQAVPAEGDPDLDGNPRFFDDTGVADTGNGTPPVVDMGASERQVASTSIVIFVPADASTIQGGIDLAMAGDEVVVAPGSYNEAINFNGKAITVRSSDPTDPAMVAVTIIDASGLGTSAVTCSSGEGSDSVLSGFTITGADSSGGGGMRNSSASPTVTHCVFLGNAALIGGGMWNTAGSSPTVTHCAFIGNSTDFDGGAVMMDTSDGSALTNCLFSGNTAGGNGGGVFVSSFSAPVLTNCTFSGNSAAADGGAIYSSESDPVLVNCILWGDTPDELFNFMGTPAVTYSDIEGGYPGTGNTGADPRFVDPDGDDDTVGTTDDNLRLDRYSPAIDAGDNDAVPGGITTDLDGNSRFFDDPGVMDGGNGTPPIVDLGAYERQEESLPVLIVSPGESIQEAIDLALDGDEVIINPGTYVEAIDFNGKPITVRSIDPSDPAIVEATILDGDGAFHVVQCISGEDSDSILDGITITGGDATGETDADKRGGGMYIDAGSPTVTRCTFSNNDGIFGGGMNITSGSPSVEDCTFILNSAPLNCGGVCTGGPGGGAYCSGGTPAFVDCTFIDNSSSGKGGGMWVSGSGVTLTRCTFHSNTCAEGGGGMYIDSGNPTLTGCVFTSNDGGLCCTNDAGGIQTSGPPTPKLTSCVFSGNGAAAFGGRCQATNCIFTGNEDEGVQTLNNTLLVNCTFYGNGQDAVGHNPLFQPPEITMTNCVVWANGGDQLDVDPASVVTHCIVQGGYMGAGNSAADPLFLDPTAGNFRLPLFSPAVDAGDNSALPPDGADLDGDGNTTEPLPYDFDGYARVVNAVVDIGAFEFSVETTTVAAVHNLTQFMFFETIAPAISAAASGDELVASEPAFAAAPTVDYQNKSLHLRCAGAIDQAAGGLYVLADDATLESASGQDITLAGELRVKSGDAADVAAGQLIAGPSGELVARTGAGLFITTDNGVTVDGEATLLDGATMGFAGGVTVGGSLTGINGATVDVSGTLSSTGSVSLLNGVSLLCDSLSSSGLMQLSDATVLAEGFSNLVGGEVIASGDIFSDVTNDALITYIGDTLVVGDYVNNDTTIVQVGTLTIVGSLTNNGTIIGDVVNGLEPGGGTKPGDGLDVVGDFTAGAGASLTMPDPVWKLSVGGDYDVAIADNAGYHMAEAELQMAGLSQTLEVMSADIGADAAGLDRTIPGHYPIGTLRIGLSGTVTLVDAHDNDGLGQETCEAIYVQELIVEAGATLNTLGCPVYYETLVLDGTVDDPQSLIELEPPCPADLDGSGTVGTADFLILLANWGTAGPGDLDGSGTVGTDDFLILLANWGPCPQ